MNHHTPPPIPKLSSITKTRILFVFLPKKCPSFARTSTKMSLSEGLDTSDSYCLMLKMAYLPPHIKAQGGFWNFLTNFPVRYQLCQQLCQLHITPWSQLRATDNMGQCNVFSFAFCTFFKIFHVRLGKKVKVLVFRECMYV